MLCRTRGSRIHCSVADRRFRAITRATDAVDRQQCGGQLVRGWWWWYDVLGHSGRGICDAAVRHGGGTEQSNSLEEQHSSEDATRALRYVIIIIIVITIIIITHTQNIHK